MITKDNSEKFDKSYTKCGCFDVVWEQVVDVSSDETTKGDE